MYPKHGNRHCDDASATLLAYLACTDAGEICSIKVYEVICSYTKERGYTRKLESGSQVLSDVLPAFCKVQQLHSTCHSAWAGLQSPELRVSECDLVTVKVDLQLASAPFYKGKINYHRILQSKEGQNLSHHAPRILTYHIWPWKWRKINTLCALPRTFQVLMLEQQQFKCI